MTRTENNSHRCGTCHRFMPRKAGKAKLCSPRCRRVMKAEQKAATARARLAGRR